MIIFRYQLVLLFLFSTLNAEALITTEIESKAAQKYGAQAKNRFVDIQSSLLDRLKNVSEIKKLNFVNTWVNYTHYASDKSVYNKSDYWATLYEFVGKNKGDCEDYTITKYYILKALGVDPKKMKFAYVIYQSRSGKKTAHMVLAYFKVEHPKTKDDILILGNNNRLVLPASMRPDILIVIKMINGDTGPKSKKWKQLELDMKRKKL